MVVRLCNEAWVKTTRGEVRVGDLKSGDRAVAYNPVSRELGFVDVTVTPIGDQPKLSFMIRFMRWINLLPDTMGYTARGPVPALDCPAAYSTYCVTNPMRMVSRDIVDVAEYPAAPASEVSWTSNQHYLWSEGILVGSN